jgi:hypothetical protein
METSASFEVRSAPSSYPTYQYYGRPTNYRSLWQFYRSVRRTWKKWLERRSRGQPLSWETYAQILRLHPLLRPWITHAQARTVSQT